MRDKLLYLQVARGVAANLAVLQHLRQFELKYADTQLPLVIQYGSLGVDIFFVLSGFVMVAVAGRNVGPLHFLWRRAARIYPTYWLATAVMLGVAFAVPGIVHERIDNIPLWRSFLLIAASPKGPVVSVGWTLVHEVYFYVVFAVFIALRIPILLGVLAWAAMITSAMMVCPDYIAASPILSMAASPLTFEFMLGVVVGTLWLHNLTLGTLVAGIAGSAMLFGAICVHFLFLAQPLTLFDTPFLLTVRVLLFGVPIALIIYAIAAYERHSSLRPPTLLVSIGDWSYSIYLFHFMALSVLGRLVIQGFGERGISGGIVLFIAGFLLVNLIGAGLYTVFERPMLTWLHSLGHRKAQLLTEPKYSTGRSFKLHLSK